MGVYGALKKEFGFLKTYGFDIALKQKHGSYYFIIWTNLNVKIMVLYDDICTMRIRVYDADSFSFDAIEYQNEFALNNGTSREKIHRAAEWLKTAIADKTISI